MINSNYKNELSDDLKTLLNAVRKEILLNKNFQKAFEIISCFPDKNNFYIKNTLALLYFEQQNYEKAKILYKELGRTYQQGFCELLLNNEKITYKLWHSSVDSSAICWGKSLLSFINLKVDSIPTFLQIRNFLEHDLEHFLRADKLEYAENLISCAEILADINLETYKFIGRALFNTGYQDLSQEQFFKSRNLIPNDPEIYYYLAKYAYYTHDYQEVRLMANECLELNASYTPAKMLLEQL